ncbi:MAG: hypothetical protein VX899_19380 [Myxococcota bacterium]|nr:hypothetical protein [Myxococcota bacterium]
MIALLLLLSPSGGSSPDPVTVHQEWSELRPVLVEHSKSTIPELSPAQVKDLVQGKRLGIRLEQTGEVDGAMGVAFMPLDTEAVWIGGLDDKHAQLAAGLTEVWLPGTNQERKILYQHLDVPAPFADRHWVVHIRNNQALFGASEGRMWERYWELDPRPLEECLAELPEEPVWLDGETLTTPVNRGSWSVLPVSGGVVVLYEVHTDIGGPVPEELMVRFAMMSLESFMDKLQELGARAPSHYAEDHFIIRRPDLSPIQPGSLQQ